MRNFTEGSVAPQLLSFAAPLFASNLLQIVYNMVDMIIVGQKLGKIGLSAVAVGGDVSHFLTFIAMGFSGAGQVIIAQYLGAGKKGEVSRFIGTMFSFLMPIAAVLSAVCIALRVPILRVMNTPAESFSEALGYATICTGGLIFVYGYNMVSSVLRGMGDSVRPFIFISISAVTNIFLDILFVAVLEMGAAGAALATVFCQMLSFTMASVYILRNRDRYGIEIRGREFFTIDRGMLSRLVRLGIPMAIKSAAVHLRSRQQAQQRDESFLQRVYDGGLLHGGAEHRRREIRQGAPRDADDLRDHLRNSFRTHGADPHDPGKDLRHLYL